LELLKTKWAAQTASVGSKSGPKPQEGRTLTDLIDTPRIGPEPQDENELNKCVQSYESSQRKQKKTLVEVKVSARASEYPGKASETTVSSSHDTSEKRKRLSELSPPRLKNSRAL
jgi:hypothetical protein